MPARKRKVASDDDALAKLAQVVLRMTPDQLADYQRFLSENERQVIERVIAREVGAGWRADPLTLGVHFGVLERLPHTELLANKFREAVEGISTRQIWNLPPQHGKSLIASRIGPAWAFDMDPTLKLALASYGDTLADENATFVRDFLVEHGDELRARLRKDRRRGDRFVTEEGGGLISSGVSGGLTGFSAHGVVVDDPFKNWEEAHSEATRLKVWNFFRSVVLPRLNVRRRGGRIIPAFVIVVMTRWHEEDLSGMLQAQDQAGEGEGWEVIRLPALAEDAHDPLRRKRGEALAPHLHDKAELERTMLALGSYLSAGLYQQRPAPEEGGEIKRAWFRYETAMPPRFDSTIASWDMKLKDKEGGDFVVGQAWGRTGADFWCLDQLRGQWNFVTTKTAIALLAVRHPHITTHVIENTGNGPEVMADLRSGAGAEYEISEDIRSQLGITNEELPLVTALLRRGISGIVAENVKGDKRVRVRRHLGIIEAGNVHLPMGKDWTMTLINECASFPTGSHDDCVDAMTQALKRLRGGSGGLVPPTARNVVTAKPGSRSVASIARPRGRFR